MKPDCCGVIENGEPCANPNYIDYGMCATHARQNFKGIGEMLCQLCGEPQRDHETLFEHIDITAHLPVPDPRRVERRRTT